MNPQDHDHADCIERRTTGLLVAVFFLGVSVALTGLGLPTLATIASAAMAATVFGTIANWNS